MMKINTNVRYATGIECPRCKAAADDRCVTTGGNIFVSDTCHRKRKDAAIEANIELTYFDPVKLEGVAGMRVCFWFIENVGGYEQAKTLMERAGRALDGG